MIKKIYLVCCLISVAFSTKFLLSMEEADLISPKYVEIKEKLLDAVESNILDQVEDAFEQFNKFAEEVPNINRDIKNQYLNDLLFTKIKSIDKSTIEIAYDKQNLQIIYRLLKEVGQNSDQVFLSHLKINLKIDPATDDYYLNQKDKLIQAIEADETETAKQIVENFKNYVSEKFIPMTQPSNILNQYFDNKIWQQYSANLMKDNPGNPVAAALTKQNFAILYLLFKYLGTGPQQYLEFIKSHRIKPSSDPIYQKIKKQLIGAVRNNKSNAFENLLTNFNITMRNKYIPQKHIPDISSEIEKDYIDNIFHKYLYDLISTLLPIALDNKNLTIMSILLTRINDLKLFENVKALMTGKFYSSRLIKFQDKSIVESIDKIIIKMLKSTINSDQKLLNILKDLKKVGLDKNRAENNILKAFASTNKTWKELEKTADYLFKNKFITDLQTFKQDFKKDKAAKKAYTLLPINEQIVALNVLNSTLESLANRLNF